MIGPRISIKLSCVDCVHCKTIASTRNGPEDFNVYCMHPEALTESAPTQRLIGYGFATPDWCPVHKEAVAEAIASIKNGEGKRL